jgi:hypothetical protein
MSVRVASVLSGLVCVFCLSVSAAYAANNINQKCASAAHCQSCSCNGPLVTLTCQCQCQGTPVQNIPQQCTVICNGNTTDPARIIVGTFQNGNVPSGNWHITLQTAVATINGVSVPCFSPACTFVTSIKGEC